MTYYPLTQTRPIPWVIHLFLEKTKVNFFFGALPSSCVTSWYMLIAQLFLRPHSAPYFVSYILCCNHGNQAMITTQLLLIDSHGLLILGEKIKYCAE